MFYPGRRPRDRVSNEKSEVQHAQQQHSRRCKQEKKRLSLTKRQMCRAKGWSTPEEQDRGEDEGGRDEDRMQLKMSRLEALGMNGGTEAELSHSRGQVPATV
uniref:Uncharacterized protein n=1 Tax=Chromera velia CCMP2878 TaxID=1169474 RepID=A0A0G4HDA0_9ALVE|eukprot:Cvel_26314.t1-p1 / transcript=Cvel_26314.t1 / gene=Cvel_26314 / organism=Chromera_velia_CCMP2878 / gene_product=hypothetical protein / transcript_product=hypothetical protein / location=Cvel_scaffold3109:2131-2433(+) / protein_length=101 / sequence_SO=supercontig / SO=protein_coding / is_pseudo=false